MRDAYFFFLSFRFASRAATAFFARADRSSGVALACAACAILRACADRSSGVVFAQRRSASCWAGVRFFISSLSCR